MKHPDAYIHSTTSYRGIHAQLSLHLMGVFVLDMLPTPSRPRDESVAFKESIHLSPTAQAYSLVPWIGPRLLTLPRRVYSSLIDSVIQITFASHALALSTTEIRRSEEHSNLNTSSENRTHDFFGANGFSCTMICHRGAVMYCTYSRKQRSPAGTALQCIWCSIDPLESMHRSTVDGITKQLMFLPYRQVCSYETWSMYVDKSPSYSHTLTREMTKPQPATTCIFPSLVKRL